MKFNFGHCCCVLKNPGVACIHPVMDSWSYDSCSGPVSSLSIFLSSCSWLWVCPLSPVICHHINIHLLFVVSQLRVYPHLSGDYAVFVFELYEYCNEISGIGKFSLWTSEFGKWTVEFGMQKVQVCWLNFGHWTMSLTHWALLLVTEQVICAPWTSWFAHWAMWLNKSSAHPEQAGSHTELWHLHSELCHLHTKGPFTH